jgi:hypothetical protein
MSEETAPIEIAPPSQIELLLPSGTPLRIVLDRRVRVNRAGEIVKGRVAEAVYAFDQLVVPEGSRVIGHVEKVLSLSSARRVMAYANGDFSPFHKYEIVFDKLTLPNARSYRIDTNVSPGTAEVVHLVSNPDRAKKKSAGTWAKETAKRETKGKIAEAKSHVRDSWATISAPGKLDRLKKFLLRQSPYRRQYIEAGTRFVADLKEPLEFGRTTRSGQQLASVGSELVPDSTLKARLVGEVSSATSSRGSQITALLTEPLYSASHQLILPANSRLLGKVLEAKPARKWHRNGELRVIFERIETPREYAPAASKEQNDAVAHSQVMTGTLEGVQVNSDANMTLDEEGGVHTTDSKTRYLSTGLAVLLAAAASNPDAEHGTIDSSGDPAMRTAAGISGLRLTGAVLSFTCKSTPVSMAFAAYGASASIYSNFLSRGRDVVLANDTPLEIGVGAAHPASERLRPDTEHAQ